MFFFVLGSIAFEIRMLKGVMSSIEKSARTRRWLPLNHPGASGAPARLRRSGGGAWPPCPVTALSFSLRSVYNHTQVDLGGSNRNLALGQQRFVLKIGHAVYGWNVLLSLSINGSVLTVSKST